jgi:hypothetical protein
MSHPSHFYEVLVGNTVTTGHHAWTMSSSYSLEKKKEIRQIIKGIEWERKQ